MWKLYHLAITYQYVNLNAKQHTCFITSELGNKLPTVKKYNDKTLMLSELFARAFAVQRLGVRNWYVLLRITGIQFSWKK